jgi:hypothetical protein
VTLFCEYEVAQLQARWHLALLAVATAWTALHELSCRSFSDVAAFNAALAMDGPAIDLEAAEASYRSTCAAPCSSGPWRAITDTADEDARHFAFNLTTLIDAQRAARPDEAVAIGIPLVGSSEGTDVSAALWTELLRAAIVEGPLPTVVIRAPNRFLCAFYRRVDGEDLAGMLSDAFDRIDRVDERWQTLPNADSQAGASLDRLVSTAPASLAELVSRVQSFERR